jgi:hypothetical protein
MDGDSFSTGDVVSRTHPQLKVNSLKESRPAEGSGCARHAEALRRLQPLNFDDFLAYECEDSPSITESA